VISPSPIGTLDNRQPANLSKHLRRNSFFSLAIAVRKKIESYLESYLAKFYHRLRAVVVL
jgi:hypothetical protein